MGTQISRPWNGNAVTGDDGPYSAQNWQQLLHSQLGNDDSAGSNKAGNDRGVVKGALLELRVQEQGVPDATVRVRSGYGSVRGAWYYNDSDETLTPDANASGSTREDIVVLRADFTAKTARLAIVKGTPAAGLPALTQTAGTLWETPLAVLVLANGFATINDTDIVDMRRWVNTPDSLLIWVQNNSALVMEGGDIAVWDGANDTSVTSSTTPGAPIAGVVEGRIPVNGWGRVQRQGIGWVKLSDAVARGDFLSQGDTALQAGNYGGATFARALMAGVANELALAYIECIDKPAYRVGDFKDQIGATQEGWIVCDGLTIGNGSSGGTALADDQAMSLFIKIWDSIANTEAPLQNSGGAPIARGASGIADFNANNRIPLPDRRGRAFVPRDDQGTGSANRMTDAQADLTGGVFGSEDHTLTEAELAAHTHTYGINTAGGAGTTSSLAQGPAATGTLTTDSTGGDTAHNNVQPSYFGYTLIKL